VVFIIAGKLNSTLIFMGILVFFIISLGCVSADPDLGSDLGYPNSSNELVSANLTQSNNTSALNSSHESNLNSSSISNDVPHAAGSPQVTNEQVVNAAVELKAYIETNHTLPEKVKVNGIDVNIYTFYYLLSIVVQNLNTNNNNPIDILTCSAPQMIKEEIHTGDITLTEYIRIADQIKVYMDKTRVVPGYATKTSLGNYLSYQSLTYIYCNAIENYKNTGTLSNSITVKPWKIISDPNARSYTNQQVITAANWLKNYVETNHQLPTTVNVNNKDINIYTFYYLLTTTVQNLNTNNNNPIDTTNINAPQIVHEEIRAGDMPLTEYIHIADVTKVYMDKTGIVPGYACQVSLGQYMSWQSLVLIYCNVLSNYSDTGELASVYVKPWKIVSNPGASSFTNEQVVDAAASLKNYVDTNRALPNKVSVNGREVDIYTFLYLLTTVVQNLNSDNSSLVDAITFNPPQAVHDAIIPGNIPLSEYIKIADQVKVYMDQTGYVPGYASQTSIGPYLSYKSMVYMYAQILSYYKLNNVLPAIVAEKPWALVLNPNALSALPVYLTSDNIDGVNSDNTRMNYICQILSSWGLTAYNYGLGPNSHCAVLMSSSVPQNALVVDIYGGACAATLYEMGGTWYKSIKGARDVFTIFMCGTSYSCRISGLAWLPRAHDDNFSSPNFTGLANPDQYLLNNGYRYCEVEHGPSAIDYTVINEMASAIYEEALLHIES
jgi:hypothetical protein